MSWTALVLAGARGPGDPVAAAAGVALKAFAPVAGRPMLAHVLAALGAAPAIGRIAVALPEGATLPGWAAAEPIGAGPSPAASVLGGAEALGLPLLVTTADHPLLSAATVGAMVAGATAAGADVAAGVALRPIVEAAGNPARRTYLEFRDGAVSGCNLFAIRTAAGLGAVRLWLRLEGLRKRPAAMALALGPGTLLLYRAGLLDRDAAARRLGRRAGCRAALVLLDDPLAAHDVDRPADLAFAERVLAGSGRAGPG